MKIAIAGGGIGGLLLARMLHTRGVEAVVYERESARDARGQGGMLDIHSGQRALREAGLIEQFHTIARPEGQDLRLFEPDGTLLLREDTPDDAPPARPEVDRADLRNLLLDSLPQGTVRWGAAFEYAANGRAHLSDGSSTTYDLLVGADGANSKVRALVTDAQPEPIGQHIIELGIPNIDHSHPELAAMLGRGNFWVLGSGQSLTAQRNGDGRVRVYLSFYRRTHEWLTTCAIPLDNPSAARPALINLFEGWDRRFTALIDACDDTIRTWTITSLPIGLRWPATPGVTLLGDAAHLMPAVGQGANMALLDAAELTNSVATHPNDLPSAISDYEHEMFTRTATAARQSADMHHLLASPDAARKMLDFFKPSTT